MNHVEIVKENKDRFFVVAKNDCSKTLFFLNFQLRIKWNHHSHECLARLLLTYDVNDECSDGAQESEYDKEPA